MRLSALMVLAAIALDPARLTAAGGNAAAFRGGAGNATNNVGAPSTQVAPSALPVVCDGQTGNFSPPATVGGVGTLDLTYSQGAPVAGGAGLRALHQWLGQPAASRPKAIPSSPLTKGEAIAALDLLWKHWRTQQAAPRSAEMWDHDITIGDKNMRFLIRVSGTAPAAGRSLWISLHGGGGTPAQVNDQQWQKQILLYQPAEGLYIAPRAPTNQWNLWNEAHVDDFLDRLIEDCVLLDGVNPDKIYLLGYSAGGNGVYQLAPRMADRFAAASAMAGHPSNASPLGLRNLPFAIFAGAEDTAYERTKMAVEWGGTLDGLARQDPGAYPHHLKVYPGLGHWMNGKDAEAVPWMAKLTRNPWPQKVVWCQSDRLHDRFYWLALPEGVAKPGQTIRAGVVRNVITLDAPDVTRVILRLHDRLVDLDQALKVLLNGKTVFEGKVPRQAEAILESLQQRADPRSAATALLEVREK